MMSSGSCKGHLVGASSGVECSCTEVVVVVSFAGEV
jgi:hypothetical protein